MGVERLHRSLLGRVRRRAAKPSIHHCPPDRQPVGPDCSVANALWPTGRGCGDDRLYSAARSWAKLTVSREGIAVRRPLVWIYLAVVLGACGGGTLTPAEYAEQAESLVAEMTAQFASLDAEWESQVPSVEGARSYWDQRLEIRAEFLEGVRGLRASEGVEAQHAAALDVFERITAADEALAARVATFDSVTEHWQWVDTPEGRAADAVLEDVYAFCRSSQEEFDATAGRESLEDVPWVPPEMKEAIKVAFGCPP